MRLLARGALAAEATERPVKAGATSRPEDVTAESASMTDEDAQSMAKSLGGRNKRRDEQKTDKTSVQTWCMVHGTGQKKGLPVASHSYF